MWWPSPRDGQARITLLGTHHFHTPGNDEHSMDLDDPLSPDRQRELVDLRKRLAERPFDHVAVEIPRSLQTAVDEQYAAIRNGTSLDDESGYPEGPVSVRSEVAQVGFRVADALGIDSVNAVDSRPDLSDLDADWSIQDDPDEVPYPLVDPEEVVEAEQTRIRNSTYLDALREQNRPAELRRDQALNIAAALSTSDGDDHAGARQTGYWYDRNARICENLTRSTGPDQETLFIVGSSHVIPVKQIAQAAPATCPRSALPLLDP